GHAGAITAVGGHRAAHLPHLRRGQQRAVSDRAPEPGQVAGGADQRASRVGPGHVLGGRVDPCVFFEDQVAGGVWLGEAGGGGRGAGGGGVGGGGECGGGGGGSRGWWCTLQ